MKIKIVEENLDNDGNRYSNVDLAREFSRPSFFGELLSPYMKTPGNYINLADISHSIDDITVKDGNVTGRLNILSTPRGIIFKHMLADGAEFEYKIRGKLEKDKHNVVTEFKLVAIDMVFVDDRKQNDPEI